MRKESDKVVSEAALSALDLDDASVSRCEFFKCPQSS